jgi:hypothetical protein
VIVKKEANLAGGLAIGGDLKADAGRDVNISAGDITTGSLTLEADWRDSAMSALGDIRASPVVRENVGREMDTMEAELDKKPPDVSVIQRALGAIEMLAPTVATVIRIAMPFLK